jgi:hypothetical protein
MGQKTNPNILRLGVKKSYTNRYIEKKSSEISKYSFNNLEIEKFIYKLFKDNQLYVANCKVNYAQDEILKIFISYYVTPELNVLMFNNDYNIKKRQRKFNTYSLFSYLKTFKKSNLGSVKKKLKTSYRIYLKRFQNHFGKKKYFNIAEIKHNHFVNLICESISKFLKKKIKIFLTLKQLNKTSENIKGKKEISFLKKNVAKFNRYTKNDFFKEGLNLLYTCSEKPNYAVLIAEFLAKQLEQKKLKRHNFFLYFVRNCLKTFRKSQNSKIEGIKIKIKGRLNKRPRARHKIFKIGKEIPALSIKSKISYCEKVAFTSNGTIGIKIWAF